mmetsp:Transcript_66248/g.149552  ORF Transcript_66248/g.149552 Transcript_66248/m.149552 type:complete len:390 (-) Transcript_66248:264-1433(-)
MPQYEKVPSAPEDIADWRADNNLQRETKFGGAVNFVNGRIDGYRLDSLLRMGFFRVHAPAFSDKFVMKQTWAVVIMVVAWAFIFMLLHLSHVMHVDSNLVGQSSDIFGYFGSLTGFLFGFFIFDNLATYTTVKNNYLGGFWGAFQTLMALTGAWFPANDPKTKNFKITIVRWGLASFNLMCGEAKDDGKIEEIMANTVAKGLLTPEEADAVTSLSGNPVVPLLWMIEVFQKNLDGHRGADFKVNKAEDNILLMRAGVGNTLTAVSSFGLTPLPLVHLMSALVKIQLLLLSVKEGVNIADILVNEHDGKTLQLCLSLLMSVATPIIFQSLLEFVIMIRNPFGDDWVDLPTRFYQQQIRDEMLDLIRAGEVAAALPTVKDAKNIPDQNPGR